MCLRWSAGDKLTNSLHMIAELFPLNVQEELLMRQLDGMTDEKQWRIPQCLLCIAQHAFTFLYSPPLFCHECNNKIRDYFLQKPSFVSSLKIIWNYYNAISKWTILQKNITLQTFIFVPPQHYSDFLLILCSLGYPQSLFLGTSQSLCYLLMSSCCLAGFFMRV